MECMLLPRKLVSSLTKIPYVADRRYDGGEWQSYPKRVGQDWVLPNADDDGSTPYHAYQLAHPTPIRDQESFLQTWLFFGLISESLGGNALGDGSSGVPHPGPASSSPMLDSIYENYISEEDGQKYINTSNFLKSLEESFKVSPENDKENIKRRILHLNLCVNQAWKIYYVLPSHFDRRIHFSIGVIGELLSYTVNTVLWVFKIKHFTPTEWGPQYYGSENLEPLNLLNKKEVMLRHGWCPSDLTRAANKFKSLQMLYFLTMLDKTKPARNHSKCTNLQCNAYQIDLGNYDVGHANEGCDCEKIYVDNSEVTRVLQDGESIPLLRFVGGIDDLKIEIERSDGNIPHIAISHVWADGLGNPFHNALHACQLVKLRSQVENLFKSKFNVLEGSNVDAPSTQVPLIWLDTLCCPVRPPEAKALSLTKMRQVYQRSTDVLVLDASLQSYKADEMDMVEQLARIFTSSWLRRLWTLQEGALAENLYFQFSDRAVSLDDLRQRALQEATKFLRWRIVFFDVLTQFNEIQRFFHFKKFGILEADLHTLDTALLHRGVSVASDEAICIATLMKLPMEEVVLATEEDRMPAVWKLLGEKNGGIQSEVIFSEGERLKKPGFRWAPASFLVIEPQLLRASARARRWYSKTLGTLTDRGLRVKYPGFAINRAIPTDNRPINPWPGLPRLPESRVLFRESVTQQWFIVTQMQYARFSKYWNDEERRVYNSMNRFPIHDIMQKSGTYLLTLENKDSVVSSRVFSAIMVSVNTDVLEDNESSLPVRIEDQVIVGQADNEMALVYDRIESFARTLRADELTDKLLSITDQESEAYAECHKLLKEKMKSMMQEAYEEDPNLRSSVRSMLGDDLDEHMWVEIGNWFHHDFTGTRLPDDQVWTVD